MAVPKPLGTDTFEAWESGGVVVSKYVELVVPRYVSPRIPAGELVFIGRWSSSK